MDDGLLGSAPGLSESLNTFRANRHRSGAVEQPGQMLATSPGLEDTVRAGAIEEMFSKSAQNPLVTYDLSNFGTPWAWTLLIQGGLMAKSRDLHTSLCQGEKGPGSSN